MSIARSKINHAIRRQAHAARTVTALASATMIPAELAVRRIAENEGLTHGFDPKDFRLEISESRTAYSVLFVPKARVRGGGLRVGIGKRDLKVKEIVHLQ